MAEWLKAAVLKTDSSYFIKLNKIKQILLPANGLTRF